VRHFFLKYLVCSFSVETFPWSLIDQGEYLSEFRTTDLSEIHLLQGKFTEKNIGVLQRRSDIYWLEIRRWSVHVSLICLSISSKRIPFNRTASEQDDQIIYALIESICLKW